MKDNEYICKTVQKSKRARPDLESVEFLSTGPNRPVEILDLIGKKPAGSNTELNWRETGPFNISKRVFHKFWSHFNFFSIFAVFNSRKILNIDFREVTSKLSIKKNCIQFVSPRREKDINTNFEKISSQSCFVCYLLILRSSFLHVSTNEAWNDVTDV